MTPLLILQAAVALIVSAQPLFPFQNRHSSLPGDNQFLAMHYSAALNSYDSLMRAGRDSAEVFWRMARAHICIGDVVEGDSSRYHYRAAEGYARRAVTLDPSLPSARTWYAAALGSVALHEGGKTKIRMVWEVKRQLDTALALNPDDDIAWSILGSFYRALANLGWIERQLAALLFDRLPDGSYEEAESALLKAAALNPDAPRHWYELGLLYLDWDKPSLARKALETAAGLPFITARDKQNKVDALEKLAQLGH